MQVQDYKNKKAQLEESLAQTQKEMYILENEINQQKELFIQQFQTDDPEKLAVILKQYQEQLIQNEEQIKELL